MKANSTLTFGMQPSTSKCLFESFQLVNSEIEILRVHCVVDGIKANAARCAQEANSSIALSTVVATALGYPMGVKVAHYCEANNKDS